MKFGIAIAMLASAMVACAEAPSFEPIMIRLTPDSRTATLDLPSDHDGRAMIEVVQVDNPDQLSAMLAVRVPGQSQPLQRFSLYPPDQPARMALRVPQGARQVIVELEQQGSASPRAVSLRVAPLPK